MITELPLTTRVMLNFGSPSSVFEQPLSQRSASGIADRTIHSSFPSQITDPQSHSSGSRAEGSSLWSKWDRGIPSTTLDSISGYKGPVQLARNLACYLKDVKEFMGSGYVAPRSVLINGRKGNGKTYLAKAIAGEAKVPFLLAHASEFCREPKAKLSTLFAMAERKAPCVLCIEEVEQLTPGERSELTHLLAIERPGVLAIATTTLENCLDPALACCKRIDFRIPMGPPNEEDRKAILKEITKEMHLDPEFDCSLIAEATWGCNSVSSLFSLLAQANVNAFGEGKPMAMRHVLAAIETAREGIEVEDLSTEEEKLFLASHEAGHALVAHLVGVKVLWVSTRPRSTGNEFQGGRTYNGVNLRIYLRRKF